MCDVCGREIGREEALLGEIEGESVVYCGEPCLLQNESLEIDRGPDPDERK